MKKAVLISLVIIMILILLSPLVIRWMLNKPLPEGQPGPEADAVARQIQVATGVEHWTNVGAVAFSFDKKRHYLWDRKRGLARVQWGDNEVLLDLHNKTNVVLQKHQRIEGQSAVLIADEAASTFNHDVFWLYPFDRFFLPDVERSLVTNDDGTHALRVIHKTSGFMPGDTFVWFYDAKTFVPYGYKIWTAGTRIGGLWMTWENWRDFSGVQIAALHRTFLFKLHISGIKTAADLAQIEAVDPFAQLKL
jgi:hypothetical protein